MSNTQITQRKSNRLRPAFAPRLVALALIGALIAQSAPATPRLSISAESIDFGQVPMRSALTHRYWLHSTGSTALEIEWTDASCPCAQLPISAKTIEPGDSVAFELILQSGRHIGRVERRPYIKTNADSEPARTFFTATVVTDSKVTEPLGFSPFRADLSQFGKHRQDTARIKFFNNGEHTLIDFELYAIPTEYFSVAFPDSIQPGKIGELVVALNPESAAQSFETSFTFDVVERPVGADHIRTRYSIPVRRKLGGM